MAKQPIILIAGEGRTVLQEDGALWPKDGLPDPDTLYTRRRVADGDLVAAPKPKKSESGEN
jgi:hypothetical protein